ncbi:MAG: anaerobic ribonucleoside-triphosphate reductase activating protein [Firmicutes bacterium]|nr:anaerobic ribonucleoside-triphosphate reductase activating protein [Bacillota bacterium]
MSISAELRSGESASQSELQLRLSGVIDESVVDGPGMRYVLFVQGCPHKCPGCHNPQTHDFEGGTLISVEEALERIRATLDSDSLIDGMTISGGEPMSQAAALVPIADEAKARGLDLMIYSGYTYEKLLEMSSEDKAIGHLLEVADKLVDGPFVMAQRDLTLEFRGSRNQRFIDLVKTRKTGKVTPFISDKWDIPL